VFSALGIVAIVQWRAGRGRAGIWAGLAFAALAFVADVGQLLPGDPDTPFEHVAARLLIAALA
jgi:hypothetical protein